jgi:dTDP-4-amino-4,6-dideoxygalactose transaminase
VEVPLLDLNTEYQGLRSEVLAAIDDALSSMQLYLGPNTQAFEREFAELCGVRHAIGVGNGTEALHFCLLACGIGPGDEVITTPWTFIATIEAIVHAGARPVVVDIDPQSYCLRPDAVEAAITEATTAVMAVHIYGHPAEMGELGRICRDHDLRLIEDAAQAHGASYGGRLCGSLGDCAAFSFYLSKNLGGYGEGGMITTDSDEIAEAVRLLRNHGHASRFEHRTIGYNGRLDEIQAAVLRVKLPRLLRGNERRREVAAQYNELLAGAPVTTPEVADGCVSGFHLYTIRAPRRDDLVVHLLEHSIGCQTHYKAPAHLQPACRPWGLHRASLPNITAAAAEVVQLPMHPGLTDEQVRYVAETVCQFYD